jgi:hypothetical protein
MINIDSFIDFCKSLVGSKSKTVGGRAWFILSCAQYNKLCYTPVSTGKLREHTRRRIEMVLNRYNKTKSLKTTDYEGITFNASSVLALIKLYCSKYPCC